MLVDGRKTHRQHRPLLRRESRFHQNRLVALLEFPPFHPLRFQALRIRRRQAVLQSVLSHFKCLMSANGYFRARSSGTQQRKSRRAVLRKEGQRVGLVNFALSFDSARAGQAPTLMTKRGQFDPLFEGRIPDVLVTCHSNGTLFPRGQQGNVEKLRRIGVVFHENGFMQCCPALHRAALRVARLVCLQQFHCGCSSGSADLQARVKAARTIPGFSR